MKLVFMGSPDFAVPALTKIINSDHEILAVYTQKPKPAGRGYKESITSVHKLGLSHNLPIFTPNNFKKADALDKLKDFSPDIIVVVAYGIILPQQLLDIPKYGAVNIHPSNLPRYRGAAPLQRTILGGDEESAVCIIQMDKGIDSGNILLKQEIKIANNITIAELHDQTAEIGADLLLRVLDEYRDVKPIKQDEENISYAAKINKEEAKINWQKDDIIQIDRKIRAFNPFPGTYFSYMDKIIKIKAASFIISSHNYNPGTIIDNNFSIACIGGILYPKILQREGKKQMDIKEFMLGFQIKDNVLNK